MTKTFDQFTGDLIDEDMLKELSVAIQPRMTKYIPHVPTPKQQAFLWLDDLDVFYGGALGGGKVIADGSFVLTPFGFKPAEDLQVGNLINNPDGSVAKIIQVHAKQEYEKWDVTFHDGAKLTVTDGHLWKAWRSGKSRKINSERTWGEDSAEIVTTRTLKEWLDTAYRQLDSKKQVNWPVIPVCKEQTFNATHKHPANIDPYLLGMLLGDGYISEKKICITTEDHAHLVKILKHYTYSVDNTDYIFRSNSFQHIREQLKKLKLLGTKSNTKFIPRQYKYGSIEDRYSVLQGLMDTDGTVDSRGQLYYTTVSKQLAEDFLFVLRSLGGVGTVHTKNPFYRNADGEKIYGQLAYNIYIKHRQPSELFQLERKWKRALIGQDDLMFRKVKKIEIGGKFEGRCITVSHPNGLYITDDFIVTHNSDALLMSALQYVDLPFYNALLIRDTYANLALPESLMFRSHEWLNGTDARWNGTDKMWIFPSGATLSFGYLDKPTAHFNYMSAEYQFVGIDEIVSIRENQARFLFSRMRKKNRMAFKEEIRRMAQYKDCTEADIDYLADSYEKMPLRFRSASNPPMPEQLSKGAWVKRRYVNEATREDRIFIPAGLADNPYLDSENYLKTLKHGLDPVTLKQLRDGDWDIQVGERFFTISKIETVLLKDFPSERCFDVVRRWDLAATPEPLPGQPADPDYTVGLKMGIVDGILYILDMKRGRWGAGAIPAVIKEVARIDGIGTRHVIEQEPGSSGKLAVDMLMNEMAGFAVHGVLSTGKKYVRARPIATWINEGKVKLVEGDWNQAFLDELLSFSVIDKEYEHDDIVDALSGGFADLGGLTNESMFQVEAVIGIGGLMEEERGAWE